MRKKLIVLGVEGQIGWESVRLGIICGYDVVPIARKQLDLTEENRLPEAIAALKPDYVINAAAYTAVDQAETDRDLAFAVNAVAPGVMAAVCEKVGATLIHISTDYVFDGQQTSPYVETDPVCPINIYGESKEAGEVAVRDNACKYIILRTSAVFSDRGSNFVKTIVRLGRDRYTLSIVDDQRTCPTAARNVAAAMMKIISHLEETGDTVWGTYHYCDAEAVSWKQFAEAILEVAGQRLPAHPDITPITSAEYKTPAARPRYSVLGCAKILDIFDLKQQSWRDQLKYDVESIMAKEPA